MKKYICDASLGKIAKHLRLLGNDCLCDSTFNENYIMFLSLNEKRIIITTRESFIKKLEKANKPPKINKEEVYSDSEDEEEKERTTYEFYFIKSTEYLDQIKEITQHFKIKFDKDLLFTRCLKCNENLVSINILLMKVLMLILFQKRKLRNWKKK
jgi:uncharacterized protein